MKRTLKSTLIAVAVGGALASSVAVAGTTSAGLVPVAYSDQYMSRSDERALNVNEREAHLRARIERGMHDGRITNREARMLLRQLSSIESRERSYMADGRLNRRENDDLVRQLDRLSDNVRAQLRDEDRRYSNVDQYGRPIR
jgi:hypothetical protein